MHILYVYACRLNTFQNKHRHTHTHTHTHRTVCSSGAQGKHRPWPVLRPGSPDDGSPQTSLPS